MQATLTGWPHSFLPSIPVSFDDSLVPSPPKMYSFPFAKTEAANHLALARVVMGPTRSQERGTQECPAMSSEISRKGAKLVIASVELELVFACKKKKCQSFAPPT